MLSRFIFLTVLSVYSGILDAQTDSTLLLLQKTPSKYLDAVSSKADKYYNSITSKTEKTLARLCKWENKIKTILEKASPETAQRLFGNNQLTFSSLLQKYKEGKVALDGYRGKYDEYRDKLITTVKYLDEKKNQLDSNIIKPLHLAKGKTDQLNSQLKNTEATEQFIRERKKQLMQQAVQYIGKSKYLQKINKEAYYYVETLKNYKEIFSDPKKIEKRALELLAKTKFFKDFMRKNSMLASLFRLPGDANDPTSQASLAGLQTRVQVNNLIQQQIAAGGSNLPTGQAGAQAQFQQNMQAAQSQLSQLKDKVLKAGGGSSDAEMPDGFKPNMQKTKNFLQRIELGTNIQNQRSNGLLPTTSDLGLSLGYKINDKSVIGVGGSFKLGLGKDIQHIRLSGQGASLRSFADVKLKGSFWVSGGYEMNYRSEFNSIAVLQNYNNWQQSGLIGVSKVVSVKSKLFKKTKLMLLWDFLSYEQVPRTQPVVFRIGYSL